MRGSAERSVAAPGPGLAARAGARLLRRARRALLPAARGSQRAPRGAPLERPHALGKLPRERPHPPQLAAGADAAAPPRLRRRARSRAPDRDEPFAALLAHRRRARAGLRRAPQASCATTAIATCWCSIAMRPSRVYRRHAIASALIALLRRAAAATRARCTCRSRSPQRRSPRRRSCLRAGAGAAGTRRSGTGAQVNPYAYTRRRAARRRTSPLSRIAAEFGTPCYVYSRAALTDAYRELRRRVRGRAITSSATRSRRTPTSRCSICSPGSAAASTSSRAASSQRVLAAGGDPAQGRVFRRRQVGGGDPRRARGRHPVLQRRIRKRARAHRPHRRRARQARAGQPARQPGRRRRHPPLHRHRAQAEQVRHRRTPMRSRCTHGRAALRNVRDRGHRLPHRLAADRDRADRRSARQDRRAGRAARRARASSSSTSTSAAAWASATRTRRRPRSTTMRARSRARSRTRGTSSCSSRAGCSRATRAAAHARRVPEARRRAQFRDRRRRDERPHAARAVRRVARGAAGARRRRDRRPTTSSGPVCETGDFLARDRRLAAREGDLLADHVGGRIRHEHGSNYNTRPRAAEVMVDGDAMHVDPRARRSERSHRARATAAFVKVNASNGRTCDESLHASSCARTRSLVHLFTRSRAFEVLQQTHNTIFHRQTRLDKGVAFFLSCSIELAHHARFFRNFFGRTMEETLHTTFEKSCDGSAKQSTSRT